MKYAIEGEQLDGIAAEDDMLDVRIQKDPTGGMKLFVDVNGITVLRICKIKQEIELTREAT